MTISEHNELNWNTLLQLHSESARPLCKVFEGPDNPRMLEIIADRRVPLSFAGVMMGRLYALAYGDENTIAQWWNNDFNTGDAIANLPNGKHKIDLDSRIIRSLSAQSRFKNGALIIGEGYYNCIEGIEFNENDKKSAQGLFTVYQIIDNIYWGILGRSLDNIRGAKVPKEVIQQIRNKVYIPMMPEDTRLHAIYARIGHLMVATYTDTYYIGRKFRGEPYMKMEIHRFIEEIATERLFIARGLKTLGGMTSSLEAYAGGDVNFYKPHSCIAIASDVQGAETLLIPKERTYHRTSHIDGK